MTRDIKINSLTVRLTRQANQFIVARVQQENSAGLVFGRNLLTKRQITKVSTARSVCWQALSGMAETIDFIEDCS